jgi:uncharacterized protein (DUF427 family)
LQQKNYNIQSLCLYFDLSAIKSQKSMIEKKCIIMAAKAIWNGRVLAESDRYEIVEINIYFPPESIIQSYFKESGSRTICPWKGQASYYTINIGGKKQRRRLVLSKS